MCDFSDSITHHLRPKTWKLFSNGVVSSMVKSYAILAVLWSSYVDDFITDLRKYLFQKLQSLSFFSLKIELERNSTFHADKFKKILNLNLNQKERRFLPPLKEWVSAPSNG